jgi:hypothetical protein
MQIIKAGPSTLFTQEECYHPPGCPDRFTLHLTWGPKLYVAIHKAFSSWFHHYCSVSGKITFGTNTLQEIPGRTPGPLSTLGASNPYAKALTTPAPAKYIPPHLRAIQAGAGLEIYTFFEGYLPNPEAKDHATQGTKTTWQTKTLNLLHNAVRKVEPKGALAKLDPTRQVLLASMTVGSPSSYNLQLYVQNMRVPASCRPGSIPVRFCWRHTLPAEDFSSAFISLLYNAHLPHEPHITNIRTDPLQTLETCVAVDLIGSFTLTNNVRKFEQDIRDNMHTLQRDYSNLCFRPAHRTMNASQLKEHDYRGKERPPPRVEVVCIQVEDIAEQVLLAHEFASEQWDPDKDYSELPAKRRLYYSLSTDDSHSAADDNLIFNALYMQRHQLQLAFLGATTYHSVKGIINLHLQLGPQQLSMHDHLMAVVSPISAHKRILQAVNVSVADPDTILFTCSTKQQYNARILVQSLPLVLEAKYGEDAVLEAFTPAYWQSAHSMFSKDEYGNYVSHQDHLQGKGTAALRKPSTTKTMAPWKSR